MSRTCSVSASNMPSRPLGDREEFEIDKSRAKFACSHPIRFESRKSSGSGSCSASSSCYPARRPLSIHRRREMRRSSTRKSGSAASVNPSSGSSDSYRSASSKAVSKEVERIDSLFHAYADPSSGLIDPEGIESFCSDLEVDYTDVRILMLAWKMKAEKQGYFTLEEWRRGLQALHADSMAKLKKALSELEKEVARPSNFSDFFTYSFRYCLTEDKQKCIDIESACELIQLVLGSQFPLQVNKLVEYLKYQRDYKVINMDQWTSFLRFCNEINFPSLDNYDEELAWPLILDNFVEWMSERKR